MVWIAADTDHHTQFLDGLRRSLALYVLAAIAICGLLSWFAARQGLAPLRDMKSRAAKVTGRSWRAHARAGRAGGNGRPCARAEPHAGSAAGGLSAPDRFRVDLAHELRTPSAIC
jgi:two-component system heavy metal sensor histidine kinase CusS